MQAPDSKPPSKRGDNALNEMPEDAVIRDNGGSRCGKERRQNLKPFLDVEKRSGRDRRTGSDRRHGLPRRQTPDRRNGRRFWDGGWVERRDAFRHSHKQRALTSGQPSDKTTAQTE